MHKKCLAAATLLGIACLAHAAKLPLYDDFTEDGDGIDNVKWLQSEAYRALDKNQLLLGKATLGGTNADTGVVAESWGLDMAANAPAKSMKASVQVGDVYLPVCAGNPTPSFVRARLLGAYFNARAGGPVQGDRTGDVLAQIRIGRRSDSTDAQDVLRVEGVVSQCSNVDCSTSTLIGNVAGLGTTNVEDWNTVQIDWDKKGNKFTFRRNGVPSVSVPYALDDGIAPVFAVNTVGLRNEAANCTGSPRIKAFTEARFDNVGLAP
jgi:hypothetical protein